MEDFQQYNSDDLKNTIVIMGEALSHLLQTGTGVTVELFKVNTNNSEKYVVYYKNDEIGIIPTDKDLKTGDIVMVTDMSTN